MDLDLVTKCSLNLLALFGINQDLLKKKLMELKRDINSYKSFLEIMTEEMYSKKLYKPVNKFHINKYKLFEEIGNQNFEEGENIHTNNKLLKAQRCLEYIYNNKFKDKVLSLKLKFIRPKSLILNNFDKFVNNNDKIDSNDKYYKSLLESFYLLQSHNTQGKIPDNLYNSIYDILVDIHILYDIPFVTIKIKEEIDFSNTKKVLENSLMQINLKSNRNISNKSVSFENLNKQDSVSLKTISSTGLNTNVKITNFQQKIKLNKNYFEKYIKKIVLFCIFCVLVVYVIILIYQLTVIKNIFNIFLAF